MMSLAHWPEAVIKTIVVLGYLVSWPLGVLWYLTFLFLYWKKKEIAVLAGKILLYVNAAFLPFILWSVL